MINAMIILITLSAVPIFVFIIMFCLYKVSEYLDGGTVTLVTTVKFFIQFRRRPPDRYKKNHPKVVLGIVLKNKIIFLWRVGLAEVEA